MGMPEIRAELAKIERTVPGIKAAFAYPSGAIAPLPAFINVMDSGEFTTPRMMGWRETVHLIKAKALVQYQADLEDAERKIEQLVYDFVNVLDKYKTLNATERVIDADVLRYEAGPLSLPGQAQDYVGVSFDVQVREFETGVVYSTTG